MAEAVRDQLREVGIAVDLQQMEFSAAVEAVYVKKDFDLAYVSFENGPDPDIGVKRTVVSTNIGPIPFSNGAGYRNPKVDDLFARAASELDRHKRAALYFEAQDILARDIQCCQSSAAMTSEGPIAAYRDRSEEEVRDIHYVRKQSAGWSAPAPVHADNWKINACPVNGPSVAADGRRVALAWYTEEGDKPRVQVALSTDAGATFGPAARVDDGGAMGRVGVVLLADGSALVSWMSGGTDGGANKIRRVAPDGTLGPVAVIARTDPSRSSGFPRMAQLGDTVYVAWTQFGKPSQVRVATADVSAFR